MRASETRAALALLAAVLPAGPRAWAAGEGAELARFAVVAGNDLGAPGDPKLRFAARDATRVAQLLSEVGGVDRRDLTLLIEGSATELEAALAEMDRQSRESAVPSAVVFFYSGHAGAGGLHLGSTILPWSTLNTWLEGSGARLKLVLIDACQAGSLIEEKGFLLGEERRARLPEGTAMLLSADASEAAQESVSLGGSIFTHYLVSGLRGAADDDGDGRVTLAEAHAYTTRNTRLATAGWARDLQHPVYRFELTGSEEVVLSDLRRGAAIVHLESPRAGQIVITERASDLVVVEAQKLAGRTLDVALPSGRYVLHLREPSAIHVAELNLPWGGEIHVGDGDLSAESYQTVAQKGGVLEVFRQRIRAGARAQSVIVRGMCVLIGPEAAYALDLGPIELAARVWIARTTFDAADTTIATDVGSAALLVGVDRPLGSIDLRAWLAAEAQVWRQSVAEVGPRTGFVPGFGAGAGIRVPIAGRWFFEPGAELMLYVPEVEDKGATVRLSGAASVGAGVFF